LLELTADQIAELDNPILLYENDNNTIRTIGCWIDKTTINIAIYFKIAPDRYLNGVLTGKIWLVVRDYLSLTLVDII